MSTGSNYNPEFDIALPFMDKYKYKMSKNKLDGDTNQKKVRRARFKRIR